MKTAESVTPMHPDKMCDQISDAILDFCLHLDPKARVAIETMGGHGKVVVMGEVTMNGKVLYEEDINKIVERIAGEEVEILTNIVNQSSEISQGVDTGGAGDQGIMIGYACNENEAMIPQELYLARSLCKFLFNYFPFDGKTQITLDDNNNIETVVASFQIVPKLELEKRVKDWLKDNDGIKSIYCNPAGDWSQGGFEADTGLTGRKLAVDSYGTRIPLGGGAFSGKDATKVDRSGAYMARRIAVDLLRQYNAKEVLVKLAYSIGIAEPVMAIAEMEFENGFKTITLDVERLTPSDIIRHLKLREPKFEKTAQWGHFGNGFDWDK